MKKIAVLGAGFVTQPAIDYFLDRCGYQVIVTSLNKQEAEKRIKGRPLGKAVAWSAEQLDGLDRLVNQVDLVLSMVPPHMHGTVARACLKQQKSMVTTSYLSPELEALNEDCHNRGILILNEIGEDPGLDNMNVKQQIDQVKAQQGKVTGIASYGAGLPAFEHNNNPWGYKFSWSPQGLISAAQTPAAYLDRGRKVEVPATALFDHHRIIDLEGIGSFETYPNRDCTKYLSWFGLDSDISFFRGLLRFTGWCNTMKGLSALNLFDTTTTKDFTGMTYAGFMTRLIGEQEPEAALRKTAAYLQIATNSDLINKLKWLGFFSNQPLSLAKGTHADVLVERMTRKLSYEPFEKDMVIICNHILAEFSDRTEQRTSTLLVQGKPGGDSAMSRAVSLPAAIASKRILENNINLTGVHCPTEKEIYHPVLREMEDFGYRFETEIVRAETPAALLDEL